MRGVQARLRGAYSEMLIILRTLYHTCRLVHGDLSEYNILVHEARPLPLSRTDCHSSFQQVTLLAQVGELCEYSFSVGQATVYLSSVC